MGHVVAGRGLSDALEFETNREHFIGRGGSTRTPAALMAQSPLSGATGAVLDPIASLRVRLRVPSGVTARVSFTTVVAETEDHVRSLVEKYQDPQVSARAFALAKTHSDIELRHLAVSREQASRYQRLAARVIYDDPRLRSAEDVSRNNGTPADLWKYGVSGDLPIVLVEIADGAEVALVQELVWGQEYLRAKGFKFDLVVLNEIPTSYRQDVQDDLQRIADAGPSHMWLDRPGGLFLRHGDAMTKEDRVSLRGGARAVFEGARGGLEVQLRRPLLPLIPPSRVALRPSFDMAPTAAPAVHDLAFFNGCGGFTRDGREYHVTTRPPTPWSNVVANPRFGFVATESGLGNTWSENSYQNRLTPWNNDPIVDPPSEALFLRDDLAGQFWTATPSPAGRSIQFTTRFGQGWAAYEHETLDLAVELVAFVPVSDPVKLLRLNIQNKSNAPRELSAFYYVDWCLSDNRSRSVANIVTAFDPVCGALTARNRFRAEFGARIAFLDTSEKTRTMTGDRTSFIGRNGTLADPLALEFTHLPGRVGPLLDPCGAVHVKLAIPAGGSVAVAFMLGEGHDEAMVRQLVAKYQKPGAADAELERVRALWEKRFEAVEVSTPDAALNVLMNRWLIYQTLSCRFNARTAFYQSGGAFGFRDQLQDVLAFLHFDSKIARDHIIRAAGRQFLEGDVQHWWHEPGGEGVRTRIQDDRLWLVYAALEYARVTADWGIFDATAPFIEQTAPGPDQHSVYERPVCLPAEASIYDHCVRAIALTLDVGAHGLPLIGTGDWNDGMDEVGAHGRGESVWLGWFLASLLDPFAVVAERRGDRQQATLYRAHAARLTGALNEAWDGNWFKRAYFDDGTPLGSKVNTECRIDSIAQSWSIISGLGKPELTVEAMRSVEELLIDRGARLILLLSPPFDKAEPNPGYIRGYLPGVRENGGQYTHAALWVILAYALLGRGDRAHELLEFINPVSRSTDKEHVRRYRLEPYVVAADIYSAAGHVGRGGWSWYTGAAAWLYRITLEHILGLKREGEWLSLDPCIPRNWPSFRITLRIEGAEYAIEFDNRGRVNRGVQSLDLDGRPAEGGRIQLIPHSGRHIVRVVLGTASPVTARAAST
jgi:cyclic beta-1,2-glucan synthetase